MQIPEPIARRFAWRNPFRLAPKDQHHEGELLDALVDDLYRRARPTTLTLLPALFLYYLVLEGQTRQQPALNWAFAAMLLLMLPRTALTLAAARVKQHFHCPRIRARLFAASVALIAGGLAAINLIAAPRLDGLTVAMVAIFTIGINSVTFVSMSPSLGTYLLYMVATLGSTVVAIAIGPPMAQGPALMALLGLYAVTLVLMALHVHFALRRSILLRLRLRESNHALQSEIDERRVAEAVLADRNAELETLNHTLAGTQSQLLQAEKMASVGQLAAGVAHEINNPIAYVRANLGSLDSYLRDIKAVLDAYEQAEAALPADAPALAAVRTIRTRVDLEFVRTDLAALVAECKEGAMRVQKIVNDLKDFSHVDAAEWQVVDIHQCLESTLNVVAHELKYKADVVKDYGRLPQIECLPFQINQVFVNLLVNAAQAIPVRGTITLRSGRSSSSVWVQISDTGSGIAPAHLDRVFEPFFTTKPVGTGTGLGLSVSYGIVQKHGGTIEVESTPGKGSSFTIRLPILHGGEAAARRKAAAKLEGAAGQKCA